MYHVLLPVYTLYCIIKCDENALHLPLQENDEIGGNKCDKKYV